MFQEFPEVKRTQIMKSQCMVFIGQVSKKSSLFRMSIECGPYAKALMFSHRASQEQLCKMHSISPHDSNVGNHSLVYLFEIPHVHINKYKHTHVYGLHEQPLLTHQFRLDTTSSKKPILFFQVGIIFLPCIVHEIL